MELGAGQVLQSVCHRTRSGRDTQVGENLGSTQIGLALLPHPLVVLVRDHRADRVVRLVDWHIPYCDDFRAEGITVLGYSGIDIQSVTEPADPYWQKREWRVHRGVRVANAGDKLHHRNRDLVVAELRNLLIEGIGRRFEILFAFVEEQVWVGVLQLRYQRLKVGLPLRRGHGRYAVLRTNEQYRGENCRTDFASACHGIASFPVADHQDWQQGRGSGRLWNKPPAKTRRTRITRGAQPQQVPCQGRN